jgi:hypothetical protein
MLPIFCWVTVIALGLAASVGGVVLLWVWGEEADVLLARAGALVLGFLLTCFWVALVIWALNGSQDDDGIAEWPGGMGPQTVCWYADKDNPDTYIRSGNVSIPIDGGTSVVTRCPMSGKVVPR